MKLDRTVLLILLFVSAFSFSQQSNFTNSQGSVDILPVQVDVESSEHQRQIFNPNGVKVYFDKDPNLVVLLFKTSVSALSIEVIDKKGRILERYQGNGVGKIHINIARLNQGDYYIRLKSTEVRDFLKFVKR